MEKISSNNNPFTEQTQGGQSEQPPILQSICSTYRFVFDSYTAAHSPKNRNSIKPHSYVLNRRISNPIVAPTTMRSVKQKNLCEIRCQNIQEQVSYLS